MFGSSKVYTKLLFALGLGLSFVSGISYWIYKLWKQDKMPKNWRRVGILAQINIFPIKSCARLDLDPETEVACETLGLRTMGFRDRCLMLIDENNKMITARVYPKMVLIESKIEGPTRLQITAPSMEHNLKLDFSTLVEQNRDRKISTSVWGVGIDVMLCGKEYDSWFSKYILEKQDGLRLVYYSHTQPVRAVNSRLEKQPFITGQDTGTFNDATSYMLVNLSSVADLNTRISKPVNPLQFRGNFYLKMDVDRPYAEDKWSWIKIGDNAVFRNVSPCTRCIFTNIDPLSGIRDPDCQPLKTLKQYRNWQQYGSSPVLGIHLGLRQSGSIKTSDVVYVGYD